MPGKREHTIIEQLLKNNNSDSKPFIISIFPPHEPEIENLYSSSFPWKLPQLGNIVKPRENCNPEEQNLTSNIFLGLCQFSV
jgi:hypothetical protein